jgi:anti-sigma factor RsiW
MNKHCENLRDQLREAALGDAPEDLKAHLAQCPDCAGELAALRARREKMEALFPLLANAEEPSPDLRARIADAVKAATLAQPATWRSWALAGAAIGIVIALLVGWEQNRRANSLEAELRSAQALSNWQAPTDVLLQTSGRELLETIPSFGDSYLTLSVIQETGGK